MIDKGRKRQVFGESHGAAKLDDAKVLAARAMRKNGETQVRLAQLFGVSRWAMRQIIDGKTWKHLSV
jgi:hypothetical protein